MVIKSLVAVTLLTGLIGAAEPGASNLFNVRSFLKPNTEEQIPVTAQLFAAPPKVLASEHGANSHCAIPLLEFKAKKTSDSMARAAEPIKDSLVKAPPLPACENWNK
jgi:hypothetical protein